jgi:uncharacterized membrane protein
MNTFDGLPTHPLLVHAAIVLIPLLAIITIALALRPPWRSRWGIPVSIVNLLMLGYLSALVMDSGEFLEHELDEQLPGFANTVSKHAELAERTRLLMFAMFLGLVALVIVDRLRSRGRVTPSDSEESAVAVAPKSWMTPVAAIGSAATIAVAVLTVLWMYRTGHEGARLVWDGVIRTK